MLKTLLLLSLLALAVHGDGLPEKTVDDYLDLIEGGLYTVEKTCWSEKQEKAADMVAREVKKQFTQVKNSLLQYEGDLALPWYHALRGLCETAENITKDVYSTFNDEPSNFCTTGENEHQILLYGLSTEEANKWIGLTKQYTEPQMAFLKPALEAAIKFKALTLDVTGEKAEKCKEELEQRFLTKEMDSATRDLKYYVDSNMKLEVTDGEHPHHHYNDWKDALRMRMKTLAGFPCITMRTINRKVAALETAIKECITQ